MKPAYIDERRAASIGRFSFSIPAAVPFRLDLTAWALRRRRGNLIDRWDGNTYRRMLPINRDSLEVGVCQTDSGKQSAVRVTVSGAPRSARSQSAIKALLVRTLGLGLDLSEFYRMASADARLRRLAADFRGVKPPRFPTVFEAVVNGIACQQFSLTVGIEMLNRLAHACSMHVRQGKTRHYAFPRPGDVVRLKPKTLRELGFSGQKTRALLELSESIMSGRLDLEGLEDLDNDAAMEVLLNIRGVGRWTAEYVLLRGLRRLDVFPGDDVGARNTLARWLGRRKPMDYAAVKRAVRRWQPYAGLVYFHMLLRGLRASGGLGQVETSV